MSRAETRVAHFRRFGALALVVAIGFTGVRLSVRYGDWIDEARFLWPRDAQQVLDRDGRPLRLRRRDGIDRRWVRYSELSPNLVAAFAAAEDDAFFEHRGVDLTATLRALASLILPGMRRSGGSTITQQTVKLAYGRPNGLWDKPFELLRALALEESMTKEAIFEQYVNRVPFGDRIVGVGRAAEAYFGKGVGELSVGEAALLAAIPQAPSITEPRRHRARAEARRAYVLGRMHALALIDDAALERALARFPDLAPEGSRPWFAPRFVDRVSEQRPADAELRTTLHRPLQRATRALLTSAVERQSSRGVTNAAGLVLDTQTAEVLAYVGAAKHDAPGGALDLLRARRQPGSSLKPFIYAQWFEQGGHPGAWLDDIHRPMRSQGGAFFDTEDYDGRERGPVLARDALAASLNLAAIDAARRVGAERIAARLNALGFRTGEGPYGAAIALGGIDVSPVELGRAMATLGRGGRTRPLSFYDQPAPLGEAVFTPEAAALTVDVLRDSDARRRAFGADLEEAAGGVFALKTGTSSGWNDAWSVAMDEHFTVVVWLGDPGGRPLRELSGFEGAAPLAAAILGDARRRFRDDFAEAEPALGRDSAAPTQHAVVCALSGAHPTEHCPHTRVEPIGGGAAPQHRCTLHGPAGTTLPSRYAAWVTRQGHGEAHDAPLRIEGLRDGMRLFVEAGRPVPLRASRPARITVDGAQSDVLSDRPGVRRIEVRAGEEVVTLRVFVNAGSS
ncbi:MAG: transglycosylase domain-containing protein [Myxococcota bacterium]